MADGQFLGIEPPFMKGYHPPFKITGDLHLTETDMQTFKVDYAKYELEMLARLEQLERERTPNVDVEECASCGDDHDFVPTQGVVVVSYDCPVTGETVQFNNLWHNLMMNQKFVTGRPGYLGLQELRNPKR